MGRVRCGKGSAPGRGTQAGEVERESIRHITGECSKAARRFPKLLAVGSIPYRPCQLLFL